LDLRITGTKGVLLLDMERERSEIRLRNGTVLAEDVPSGHGDYECADPVNRWIDLIRGRATENNSPLTVGARSVAVVAALLASGASACPVSVVGGTAT
jgi:predicted dehydrogenase